MQYQIIKEYPGSPKINDTVTGPHNSDGFISYHHETFGAIPAHIIEDHPEYWHPLWSQHKRSLLFIYDRMVNIHHEKENIDYMIFFKEAIGSIC